MPVPAPGATIATAVFDEASGFLTFTSWRCFDVHIGCVDGTGEGWPVFKNANRRCSAELTQSGRPTKGDTAKEGMALTSKHTAENNAVDTSPSSE
mmetsp:Transcript_57627/g.135098  ORF Transcript_57627/g.135098 Transcript_57627/m.135098 type:complete len:95 (+) Transcript_57627:1091-1375(+)